VKRVHRAWFVALSVFLVLIASAAFRSSVGVMLDPIEDTFGWSRSSTSLAVAINLIFYGLTAPFAAALMERYGVRVIASLALIFISSGSLLTLVMNQTWHLVVLWGVLIGLGTGSTALVFGSLVVGRWFEKYRGVVFGVIGSAFATGQLIFLPIIAHTVESSGWQEVSLWVGIGALILVPLVWFTIADSPAQVGLLPLGVDAQNYSPPMKVKSGGFETATKAISELISVYKSRIFILLATTFFICGWTTNGIISTHFVPAAHDHGMSTVTASGLLAIVGIFDIAGTIGSGWLSERFDPRKLLAIYYSLRGVALLAVPIVLGPNPDIPIFLTMMLFGLDWVATVPPTVILCQRAFGVEKGSVIFGWVFASHMIGAAIAASFSGLIRDQLGNYTMAWYFAGFLALLAGVLALMIPKTNSNANDRTAQHL
jgi:cyanate permease